MEFDFNRFMIHAIFQFAEVQRRNGVLSLFHIYFHGYDRFLVLHFFQYWLYLTITLYFLLFLLSAALLPGAQLGVKWRISSSEVCSQVCAQLCSPYVSPRFAPCLALDVSFDTHSGCNRCSNVFKSVRNSILIFSLHTMMTSSVAMWRTRGRGIQFLRKYRIRWSVMLLMRSFDYLGR